MGLFSGPQSARAEWGTYPAIPPNSAGGHVGTSFSTSTVGSPESAMRKVAVGSAVRLIAGLVAALPRDGVYGDGADRRPAPLPVFFADPDGMGQGMDDWLEQAVYSLALRGNMIGQVLERDSMGRPSQVLLKHPDDVGVFERADGPEWRFGGKLVPTDQVWHKRMFPVPGQRLGMSVIAQHAVTVLQGNAAAAFGLRWFLDGAHPSAILQNTDARTIDDGVARTVKAKFLAAVRGTREPVVVGSGWQYTAIQVSPNESQFLDTQRYTAAECARIFGPGIAEVLGYETGGSMTYANVEQRSIDLLKFTLNRWLRRFEGWFTDDMLARPRQFKFNRGALLETDLLTRYRAHEIGIRAKFLVPNEARAIEDKPPLEGGDEVVASPAAGPTPVTVEES